MPALFDFKGYDNEVVKKRIESILISKVDMNQFSLIYFSQLVLQEHVALFL